MRKSVLNKVKACGLIVCLLLSTLAWSYSDAEQAFYDATSQLLSDFDTYCETDPSSGEYLCDGLILSQSYSTYNATLSSIVIPLINSSSDYPISLLSDVSTAFNNSLTMFASLAQMSFSNEGAALLVSASSPWLQSLATNYTPPVSLCDQSFSSADDLSALDALYSSVDTDQQSVCLSDYLSQGQSIMDAMGLDLDATPPSGMSSFTCEQTAEDGTTSTTELNPTSWDDFYTSYSALDADTQAACLASYTSYRDAAISTLSGCMQSFDGPTSLSDLDTLYNGLSASDQSTCYEDYITAVEGLLSSMNIDMDSDVEGAPVSFSCTLSDGSTLNQSITTFSDLIGVYTGLSDADKSSCYDAYVSVRDALVTLATDDSASVVPTSDLAWSASALFNVSSGDVSIALLSTLFGQVGEVLSGVSNVAGQIFRLFNIGLMAVAGAFVAYTTVSNVVRTAQDAGAAGRKFNFKLLLRVMGGMTLLTPGVSGYSLIQVLVMGAVVYGVGLADVVWNQALTYLEENSGVAYSVPTSNAYDGIVSILNGGATISGAFSPSAIDSNANTGDIVRSAYLLALAKYYTDNLDSDDDSDYEVRYGAMCFAGNVDNINTYGNQVVCFGSESNPGLLGTYYWGLDVDLGDQASAVKSAIYTYVDAAMTFAEAQAYSVYEQVRNETSSDISCSGSAYQLCTQAAPLVSMSSTFYQTLAALPTTQDSDQFAWVSEAKEAGWASAGNYYYQLIGETASSASPLLAYGSDLSSNMSSHYQLHVFTIAPSASTLASAKRMDQDAVDAFSILMDAMPSQLNKAYDQLMGQAAASGQVTSASDSSSYQSYATKDLMGELVNIIVGAFAHVCDDNGTTDDLTDDVCTANIGNGLNLSDQSERETMSNTFYGNYEIAVPQNNVVVMMADIIGGFFGLQILSSAANNDDDTMTGLYDDGMSIVYDWWPMGTGCKTALDNVCYPTWADKDIPSELVTALNLSPGTNVECYAEAVKQNCIMPGVGLIGSYSLFHESMEGEDFVFLDALGAFSRLGRTLMRGGVNYYRTTIEGTFNKAWIMVGLIQKQVYWSAVAGGLASAAASLIPNVGGALSSGLAAVTNILNGLASFTFQWDLSALYYWLPLGATLAGYALALGVLVAMFVPLLPWMMFVFSVIGWAIAVVEAMVAAPIIALGVTHPEGHDLLGRSQQSMALLLSVFVRPMAILFGFITAIGMLYIGYQLLNFGFMQVIQAFYQDINDQTFLIFAMSMMGWISIYCYVGMTLVTEVCSMIYIIPDMLIRWIGGQPDQSDVRGIVGKVRSALKEAGEKGSEGASRQGSSGAALNAQNRSSVAGSKGHTGKESKQDGQSTASSDDGGGASGGGGD